MILHICIVTIVNSTNKLKNMATKKENGVLPVEEIPKEDSTKAMRKYREKIKARYPDANPQTDDEWLDMEDKYAEEVEGMLSQNEADSQVIKEVMMAYPELAMFLNDLFVNKLPLRAAIAKHFAQEDLIPQEGDDDYEVHKKASQERLETVKKREAMDKEIEANQDASISAIDAYAEKNGYSEEQKNGLLDFINDTFQELLMKKISENILSAFDKAMNYDNDVTSAAQAGEVSGKNAAIELKKGKVNEAMAGDGVPILGKGGAIEEKEIGRNQRLFGDIGKRKGI